MLFCHFLGWNLFVNWPHHTLLLGTEIGCRPTRWSVSPEPFGMWPCSFSGPAAALHWLYISLAAVPYPTASILLLFYNQRLCLSRRMWMHQPLPSKSVCAKEDRILRSCDCQLTSPGKKAWCLACCRAWFCTLALNLGIASAGIRVNPGQTETRFCLCSFLKLISLFSTMHISTFVLMKALDCSRGSHGKYLWALAISLKYYSRFDVCFGALLWKIVECVCLYAYGERGLLLIVPLWGCQTVWPRLFYCKWKGPCECLLCTWTGALLGTTLGSSSVSLKNHPYAWILFTPHCYK